MKNKNKKQKPDKNLQKKKGERRAKRKQLLCLSNLHDKYCYYD